jgi:beta-lactamase regulating signal transducer with metallopeptidase domain
MSADILALLTRTSVVASTAIIVVLLLRRPLRAAFGAQIAYAFWLLAPFAILAALLPARRVVMDTSSAPAEIATAAAAGLTGAILPGEQAVGEIVAATGPTLDLAAILLFVWLTGVFLSVLLVLRRQARALRDADAKGPAVIGVLRPHMVLPADFEQRYTPAERDLVIAHERAHIEAYDVQINALAAFLQCLNWFNPLFHAARRAFRIDQELACDARVMARHANARRIYAEAMLKTQLAALSAPLGCHWPPTGAQALKQRIIMLARPRPTALRIILGAALCAAATLAAGAAAWATQEPRVVQLSQQGETSSASERALGRRLVQALQEGQMAEARELVEAGADVNYHLIGDGTPLVIASRSGSLEMAQLLIEHGADVNQPAPGDGNPLIMASAQGHLNLVTLLVSRGADVNGVVHGDETPLINAARNNRLDVARYLVDHDGDVNLAVMAPTMRGTQRRSPLSEAQRRGHEEMVRFLRESGAAA